MNQPAPAAPPLANAPCFIETQFPVAKLSDESYAERRANQGQSITSLGKWWGRKPLILVRAALLGLLLPASDDPGTRPGNLPQTADHGRRRAAAAQVQADPRRPVVAGVGVQAWGRTAPLY